MSGFRDAKKKRGASVAKNRITNSQGMLSVGTVIASMCRAVFIGFGLVVLSSCRATAVPAPAGTSVTLPVTLSTGTQAIAALQFDVDLPVGVSTDTVTAGSSAIAAQKQISTNMVNGDLRVIISGVNQNAIPSGPVALISFKLAPSMPTGTFQMTLANVVASDPAGLNVPLAASVPGILSVIANVLPFLKMGSN